MESAPGLWWWRLPSWASAAAFTVLVAVLAATEQMPRGEAGWAALSVLLAYLPSGWIAPVGWRRRAAETALIPAACVLVLVADLAMRRMLLPPLLVLAALAALSAALSRAPSSARPLLVASLGLAVRSAAGVGLAGAGPFAIAVALLASAVIPWAASYWGSAVGVAAALALGALPLVHWPVAAIVATVVTVWLYPWGRPGGRPAACAERWLPPLVAACLFGVAVSPWGGMSVTAAFPHADLVSLAVALGALLATVRLPYGAAGAVWLVALLALGTPLGPSPDRGAVQLTSRRGAIALPAATERPYLIDLGLRGARDLEDGTPVARLTFDGRTRVFDVGREAVDAGARLPDQPAAVRHRIPRRTVSRPARIGAQGRWRLAARTVIEVPAGERPLLERDATLGDRVRLIVEAAGPSRPTPPRDWALPLWIWASAALVAALQLTSGGWRRLGAVVPWSLLVSGQVAARAWVEPLRLVGERFAVDLCLAAVLAAWLPAAWMWLRRGRWLRAAAWLLLPLALATPHLTPPLYGDEPFHLAVMESLTADHDLDISDNLDLERRPGNRTYLLGDPLLHSPVLGFLLMPGYLVAGRSGALFLLALMGALLVALIARAGHRLGVPGRRLALLLLGLLVTYPLAVFATQIWPELPGALAVGLMLGLADHPRGPWIGTASLVVAAAVKTRLGLVTFPPALVLWWRRRGGARIAGLVVLAAAAGLALAVGWLAMGHPFGFFRRLGHLVPQDPLIAARVVGGLLFDHAGGLALAAPLLLVAVASVGVLWRRGGATERAAVVGGGLTVALLLHSLEWYGGGSPPARYLVPLLPVMGLALGVVLTRPLPWRRLCEILLVPSLVMWWVLITRPHFSVNPGDGGWWLADVLARRFAADTQQFLPSFLVPTTATLWFPLGVVATTAGAVWLARRSRMALHLAVRGGVTLWLVLAAILALAVSTRCDRVVEIEAAQVRRPLGEPEPPVGTFSRFTYRNGWRIRNAQWVVVPVKLASDSEVWLEGWLTGRARLGARLEVRWNDLQEVSIPVAGSATDARIRLPDPPGPGRHRLRIALRARGGGGAVLDRVVVDR